MMADIRDDPDRLAGRGDHRQPDQFMIVKLVGVLRWRHLGRIHGEPGATQALGLRTARDPRELDEQPPGVPPHGLDGQRPRGRWVGRQDGANGEPNIWIVGVDVDRHRTADPVGPPDPANDQLHAWLTAPAHVERVAPDVPAPRERADDRTQGLGGPPAPADDLAEVVRVHPDLKDLAPAQPMTVHPDVVRVLHDALHHVLKGFLKHFRLRCLTPRHPPQRRPPRCPRPPTQQPELRRPWPCPPWRRPSPSPPWHRPSPCPPWRQPSPCPPWRQPSPCPPWRRPSRCRSWRRPWFRWPPCPACLPQPS